LIQRSMRRKHPIDEYFRKELEGHKVAPSASVWEKIETQTQSKSKKRGGVYLLRAAMITLLVGLSTYFYFEDNSNSLMTVEPVNTPVTTVDVNEEDSSADSPSKKEEGEDRKEAEDKTGSDKTEVKNEQKKAKPQRLPSPQVNTRQRYVENTTQSNELMDVVDEEALFAEEEPLISEELKVEEKPRKSRIKVKLSPNTIESFYAEAQEEEKDKDLGNRMLAYANTQVSNLVNGRKLELPKTQSKPQLEFNLPRLFN